MTPLQSRMMEAYQKNPLIGRKKLMREAQVSAGAAQRFLERQRGKVKTPLPPKEPAPPDSKAARLEIENKHLRQQVSQQTEQITRLSAAADLLKDLSSSQLSPPKWLLTSSGKTHRAIATATLADPHFDEVVNPIEMGGVNAYNREIARLRLRKFFSNTVKLGKEVFSGIKMEGLVLAMLGDIVSGAIHEELQQTNAAAILDTCLFWSEEIAAGIDHVAKFYERVFCPCVVGNHGRLTRKPRHKGRVKDNFDYLIYSLVARHFKDDNRITFLIPETSDAHYTIYSSRYCATHGDQFRGGTGIAGALSPLLLGDARKRKRSSAINTPYDYLIAAHWHQEIDTNGLIVSNTMKGYDEYAMNCNLPFSQPSQGFWLTDPDKGRTIRTSIHVRSSEEKWDGDDLNESPLWLRGGCEESVFDRGRHS